MIPTIFDCCRPREDVLSSSLSEYAADLRSVIADRGAGEYANPQLFFANTFPTDGLRKLLEAVGRRLSRAGGDSGSTIRLDSTFGGGKTHGLIALVHLARTPQDVPPEFLDPAFRSHGPVAIAAFDGEMANVAAGVELEGGIRAKTPWGYLAYKLGGLAAFERLSANDEQCSAPGSDDWLDIIGHRPALVLIDELGEWLRKLRNKEDWKQLAPFLKGLMAAVDARPDACLVLSLAVGASGRAVDAFKQEHEYVASALQEAEAVTARKMVILNPTREDETAMVLARRLFAVVDRGKAGQAIDAYTRVWDAQRAHLPEGAFGAQRRDSLKNSYPFHPDLIETLNSKTATFQNFQRVRGMLRILAPTIRTLWEKRSADAATIHVHHIDLSVQAIRTEFTTRLGQQAFDSAISYDIANADPLQPARAQRIDDKYFKGLSPFGSYAARTIFVNSMAYNDDLRGVTSEQLRAQMLSPTFEGAPTEGGATFIEEARKRFSEESGYLDDRVTSVLRFAAEANLTRLIEQAKANVDRPRVREELTKEIKSLYQSTGASLDFIPFPASPGEIPDDANEGRPFLAVIGYEAEAVEGDISSTPPLVARLAQFKGNDGTLLRGMRNNVIFLLADVRKRADMEDAVARRIALEDLEVRGISSLANHQGQRLRELKGESVARGAIAVQQCYRHVFFPSGAALDEAGLAHLALEVDNASANPGAGQKAVIRALRNHNKINAPDDIAINAQAIRDKVAAFRSKGFTTTLDLREEFRRDRALPMLLGDEPFRKMVREGVDRDFFVYVKGDVVYAAGTPPMGIEISENAILYTKRQAEDDGVWPRRTLETEPTPHKPPAALPASSSSLNAPPQLSLARTGQSELTAEGPMREAFARLGDGARERAVTTITALAVMPSAITDAAALVRFAPNLRGTTASIEAELTYESKDRSECKVTFKGSAAEARHAVDFAVQQIRTAADHYVDLRLSLQFDGAQLPIGGSAYTKLAEELARVAPGPVRLEARA